jgi:hypothetical protein
MRDTAEDLFNNEGREPCAAQECTAKLMLPCMHKKHHIVSYPPGDEILRAVGERGKLKGVFDVFAVKDRLNLVCIGKLCGKAKGEQFLFPHFFRQSFRHRTFPQMKIPAARLQGIFKICSPPACLPAVLLEGSGDPVFCKGSALFGLSK